MKTVISLYQILFCFSNIEPTSSQESSQTLSQESSQGSYVEGQEHRRQVDQLNTLLSSTLQPVDFQVVQYLTCRIATETNLNTDIGLITGSSSDGWPEDGQILQRSCVQTLCKGLH